MSKGRNRHRIAGRASRTDLPLKLFIYRVKRCAACASVERAAQRDQLTCEERILQVPLTRRVVYDLSKGHGRVKEQNGDQHGFDREDWRDIRFTLWAIISLVDAGCRYLDTTLEAERH